VGGTSIAIFTPAAPQAPSWVDEFACDLNRDERRASHLLRNVLDASRGWLSKATVALPARLLPGEIAQVRNLLVKSPSGL